MAEHILETRLTTRGYELAAYGVIPVSGILRYLEHQRWQTFTTEGPIPTRRFWPLGVVRAQQVDVIEQLSFHTEIELTLWVSRVGRTSLDFSHDITRASDGKVVARSTATVVALDETRAPKQIDAEARDYIVQRPTVELDPPRTPRPSDVWERPIFLRPSDHDLQQHVNHARYADLLDDVRLLAAADGAYGASPVFQTPVKRLYLQYDREARTGDEIVGRTWRASDADATVEVELAKTSGDVVTRARLTMTP